VRILLFDSGNTTGNSLISRLTASGYVVDHASDAMLAEHAAKMVAYELIILDRDLQDGDGLLLISALKAVARDVRIIVLTALGSLNDRIAGLNAGADDCLTKPVHFEELLARMRAALRRPGGSLREPIQCAGIVYYPGTRQFLVNEKPSLFNRRQHLILELLMTQCRRAVHRETIIEQVYGFDDEVQSNTLDAHISRIRSKLSELQSGVVVLTIRGVGYMLMENKDP
jgi:two-component system, OmpR family, response regulator